MNVQDNYGRVGKAEILTYSSVNFGLSLLSTTVATFVLYFFTDVLTLPVAAVSLMLLVVRFFDGAIDPFIAYYMDGRGTRFGKFKGYLFYWSGPFCAMFVLLFVPCPFTGWASILWYYAVYFLWSLSYSMLEVTGLSLLVSMSSNPAERRLINSAKIMASIFAVLVAMYLTLKFAGKFGGGSEQKGFSITAILFAAVALVAILPGTYSIKERNISKNNTLSLRHTLWVLMHNKKLIALFFMFSCNQFGSAIKGQATIYYLKYNVNRQDLTPLFLVTGVLSSLLMQPVIIWTAKRIRTTHLIFAGYVGAVLSMLMIGFSGRSLVLLMMGNILYGMVAAFPANLIYVYTADLVDEQSKDNKTSLSAIINSLLGLSSKLGYSVAGASIALVLFITSYTPNTAQSETSLLGIQLCFVLLTCLAYVLAAGFAATSFFRSKKTQKI